MVPDKNEDHIRKYYLSTLGEENTLCIPLWFKEGKKKVTANERREWFKEVVLPKIEEYNCEYLLICDAESFKILSGKTKAEPCIGYVYDCALNNHYIAYVPSYKTAFREPERTRERINLALTNIIAHSNGKYIAIGSKIIKSETYPDTIDDIKSSLLALKKYPFLTCDIETWSLKHYDSGIASICFCWNQNEGIAFRVDKEKDKPNKQIRKLLTEFFIDYKGTLIFHNITFDCYVLTYQLFMNSLHDIKGMLNGIEVLLRSFEDTKLIAYLATNSCAGNNLGLKTLAHEFAGDWAEEEINNIDAIPEKELLRYNLIDGLSTWFVYNKYYPLMVQDEQFAIYNNIFKPACKDIIQMQLTGLPINMNSVLNVQEKLRNEETRTREIMKSSSLVQEFMKAEAEDWVFKRNQELKKKKVTVEDFKEEFNPASSLQLRRLLYNFLSLPVLDTTSTGEAATGKKDLEKLLNQTEDIKVKELLQAIIDWKDVSKILTAFIPAFLKARFDKELGTWFLFGNQIIGGTVSGRLASNSPNLANLPSGSKYGSMIKDLFQAPKGWILIDLDFNALESRIDALVTKDPAKLDVFIHGWDSHMWNCIHYWPEKFHPEEIEKRSPQEIAAILKEYKEKYKKDRSKSKPVSFGCQYGATYHTLMNNCGFSKPEAMAIIDNYHKLYKVSEQYKENAAKLAERDGFVTGAFGLRVRTPRLKQTILGTKVTPQEAEAEKRTACNAIIQSFGMLTTRALQAFMKKVRASPYKYDIWPVNSIHDALYFLVRDDIDLLVWVNNNLVKEFQWQNEPMIQHDKVHLGGEVSVLHPSWAYEIGLPNNAEPEEILEIIKQAVIKYKEAHPDTLEDEVPF